MMNKDEAVQKLSKIARISVAYAEDLYDSFFPKPVIPYYIADYLEKVKSEGDLTVVGAVNEAPDGHVADWLFLERVNTFAQAWVNGYIVEGGPRYAVKVKGIQEDNSFLTHDKVSNEWFFGDDSEVIVRVGVLHTRKELESNGFGWVFSCEGVEVKEVDDDKVY